MYHRRDELGIEDFYWECRSPPYAEFGFGFRLEPADALAMLIVVVDGGRAKRAFSRPTSRVRDCGGLRARPRA